jgi:DnaJ-class molecular chaperone
MYARLQLSEKANSQEIKRAYYKLSLKYHPDKQSHKDEISKQEDIRKFIEIKEAYEILSDPWKRNVYDNRRCTDSNDISDKYENFNVFFKHFQTFLVLVTSLYKKAKELREIRELQKDNEKKEEQEQEQEQEIRHDDKFQGEKLIKINISVHFEDVYNGVLKKVVVKTKELDGSYKSEPLYVSFINFQSKYMFKGKGDELYCSRTEKVYRGDICVHVRIYKHDRFQFFDVLHPYDIVCDLDISLSNYLYGIDKQIDVFGNICRIIHEGNKCSSLICINNYGLLYNDDIDKSIKRGNLHVYLNLVLPKATDLHADQVPLNKEKINEEKCQLKKLINKYCN